MRGALDVISSYAAVAPSPRFERTGPEGTMARLQPSLEQALVPRLFERRLMRRSRDDGTACADLVPLRRIELDIESQIERVE
jgi:hypothetical protein